MSLPSPLSSSFVLYSGPNPAIFSRPSFSIAIRPMPVSQQSPVHLRFRTRNQIHRLVVNANGDNESESGSPQQAEEEKVSSSSDPSEIGAEIRSAMKERKEKEGDDLWTGVADEIRNIEWPGLGKVVRTTGVVLGVIAGSSVVLLTVNAILAELSDRVFVGKGVQDFFS